MRHAARSAFALMLVCGVGAAAQESAPAAALHPDPPGALVDLGGYKLHMLCTGKGSPAVVLSAGAGDFSLDWALVQPELAKITRVCSYDRAGEGWSDLGPTPRTRLQEVFDLRRALAKAHETGPFVLVGHSMGGDVARVFAMEHPADVAGIVLVDAGNEDDTVNLMGKFTTLRATSKGRPIPEPRSSVTAADGLDAAAVAQIEAMVKKFDMAPKIEPPYDRLPPDVQRLQLWSASQPRHWAATDDPFGPEEAQRLYELDHRTPHPLGSIPLVVLSQDVAGRTDEHAVIHARTQRDMAQYSERGRQIVVPGAGHHIQLEHPEVVVSAVRQLLEGAR
jgi:pimeloyl-ACP methyl ester carboxylesterase